MMVQRRGRSKTQRGVDLNAYRGANHVMPPVAIPTKGREDKLCCQTLATLQRYHWDMSKVHVFVDPVARRADGTLEHDC